MALVVYSVIARLFPLSGSEVIGVVSDGSLIRISFSISDDRVLFGKHPIPVLNHGVGLLSHRGRCAVNREKREVLYINSDHRIERVDVDSLSHSFLLHNPSAPFRSLSFSSMGLLCVSEDRRDVYLNGSDYLFSTVTLP